jgi:hypothetical protein
MRGVSLAVALVASVPVLAAQPEHSGLALLLERAGKQVERYFTRAQSLICLEVVRMQPLTASWSSDGLGRTVESELRLSWTPSTEGAAATEAQTVRQLLKVNGSKPRHNDWKNCTTPEQQSTETPPLSLLLPAERSKHRFAWAGTARIAGRKAVLVDYWRLAQASVEASMVEGRDDCVSFDVDGGMRGRLWLDAETDEVLRLDQSLKGMVEIRLPREVARYPHNPAYWTLERWDISIQFKRMSFTNPDETLVLPASMSSMQVTRGAGTPRLRTTTEYVQYQRFLTGGRVVGS